MKRRDANSEERPNSQGSNTVSQRIRNVSPLASRKGSDYSRNTVRAAGSGLLFIDHSHLARNLPTDDHLEGRKSIIFR